MRGIRDLYTVRAGRYDLTSNLYYLMGVRVAAYRKKAVQALQLQPGNRVLDLACGTGLNFAFLEKVVGERGAIVGLDFTPAMLERAKRRVQQYGWKNVEFIEGDATRFAFDREVDGILCTFALSTMPNYPALIERSWRGLRNGGRLVVLDAKAASRVPNFLNSLAIGLTKPFGGSQAVMHRQPWKEMRSHFRDVQVEEYYLGFIYIVSGTKGV